MTLLSYSDFLVRKTSEGADSGFAPLWMPDFLFDFQRSLVDWAVNKGRDALFADCGLGKTPMGLTWASNVARKTGRPVLYLTPLAVGAQTIREAQKFGIEAAQSRDGRLSRHIVVTNYELLHLRRCRPAGRGRSPRSRLPSPTRQPALSRGGLRAGPDSSSPASGRP